MQRIQKACHGIRQQKYRLMQPLAELLFDFLQQLVHAFSGLCRDADAPRLARKILRRQKVTFVVAPDDRHAGFCQLRNQPLDNRHMLLPLGIRAVDHVNQHVRVFEFFQRRLERLYQMVRQLRDKPDRVGQQHLARIGHRQLPGRRVERVKQAVVCRNVRAGERV